MSDLCYVRPERSLTATPAVEAPHIGEPNLAILPGGWLEGTDERGMRARLPPPVPDFLGSVKQQLANMRGAPFPQ